MKKIIRRIASSTLLLGIACTASAQTAGSTGNVEIRNVGIEQGLGVVVELTAPAANTMQCQNASRLLVLKTNTSYKDILAVVMLAKATQTPVTAWITSCTTSWGQSWPTVFSLGTAN